MMRRPTKPDIPFGKKEEPQANRLCSADGCNQIGEYPAPKSRDALRDYLWFCLDHIRAYNKSWNYYEGLQGAALEAEIRRATTWERPSWKFATGQATSEMFDDTLGLFDFENRESASPRAPLSPEENKAWKTIGIPPIADLAVVKKRYKELAKENHPDRNGGDVKAEERLKEINLAYDLIRKSLSGGESRANS